MISESIASKDRGQLVLGAFAFQAIGALVGTVVGYVILSNLPEIGAWRWMYATAIVPAILVVLGRLFISDSGHWLMSQGRKAEAEAEVARLLEREPPYPKEVRLADLPADEQAATARGAQRRLARALHVARPARHHPRLGAVVPAGSRHLRHRHLHADHPGQDDRPRDHRTPTTSAR